MTKKKELKILLRAKNITSSKGLLTGVLNLTMDSATIIPNDKAMLLDIKVVMIDVIGGSKQKVKVWWYVVTHFWLANVSDTLNR